MSFVIEAHNGTLYSGVTLRNSSTTVALPSSFTVVSNVTNERNKGLRVKAEGVKTISVVGFNFPDSSSAADTFLVLSFPNTNTSDSYTYYSVVYDDMTPNANYILLISRKDNTAVISDTTGSIVLGKFETYLIESLTDLTGLRITTDWPLGFIPGHQCTTIPSGSLFCDHLSEQIPPTEAWGSSFLTASFQGRNSGEIYRVLAAHNSTEVHITCSVNAIPTTFNISLGWAGDWEEFRVADESLCGIVANKPILVIEFALSLFEDSSGTGDPFELLIPPIDLYTSNYIVNTPTDFSTNFITVYVTEEHYQPELIMMDGSPVSGWTEVMCETEDVCNPVIYACGYVARLAIGSGDHRIQHNAIAGRIGITVHGFEGRSSYGHPAGLQQNIQIPAREINVKLECCHP